MNGCETIRHSMAMPDFVVKGYLADLSDADLLIRPTTGANHIAWQLGHLITSERNLIEAVCPGKMPELPAGFAEMHTKETASSDNPQDFLTKDEYLALADKIREATLAALSTLTDADLDNPGPEAVKAYAPNVAAAFNLQPIHWMMHAGQWVVTRRKLGRPPLF